MAIWNLGAVFIAPDDALSFDTILAHFTILYGESTYTIGRKKSRGLVLWRCYFRFSSPPKTPEQVDINGQMSFDMTLNPMPIYHDRCYVGEYRSTIHVNGAALVPRLVNDIPDKRRIHAF